jgi:hypothetical protein
LTAATDEDRSLWDRARAQLTDGWLPSNVEKARAYEVLGRGPDGGLVLRASAWAGHAITAEQARAALSQAGDAAGNHAQIVKG